MKLLSDNHVVVRLVLDHPVFGELLVDTFQRTKHQIFKEVIPYGSIFHQGIYVKICGNRQRDNIITLVVPYDWKGE